MEYSGSIVNTDYPTYLNYSLDLFICRHNGYFDCLQVAEYESTTFSIFYNNALFLSVLIFASFYLFPSSVSATINYVASMGLAAGLIALLSTGTAPA